MREVVYHPKVPAEAREAFAYYNYTPLDHVHINLVAGIGGSD